MATITTYNPAPLCQERDGRQQSDMKVRGPQGYGKGNKKSAAGEHPHRLGAHAIQYDSLKAFLKLLWRDLFTWLK
jgi:hypothetical protein